MDFGLPHDQIWLISVDFGTEITYISWHETAAGVLSYFNLSRLNYFVAKYFLCGDFWFLPVLHFEDSVAQQDH